jgi:RNA polymerase sigma-70 factor (ECF subfamily)
MKGNRGNDRPSLSDRDLVVAFKQGDGRAYDEIYRRHSPKIRVVCSRRLGHAHDAEEALQETFLRAYQALPRFNGQYKLGAWLNRIAINVCIDELRHRTKAEIVQDLQETALASELGPEEIVSSSRPEVIEALGELKPLHAWALRLRAVDGLSHEELAGRLQMSPSQVKALLHRARLSFKRVLRGASGWVLAPFAALRRARNQQGPVSLGGAANAMGFFAAVQASLPTVQQVLTGTVVAALAVSGGASAALSNQATTKHRSRSIERVHPGSLRAASTSYVPTAQRDETVNAGRTKPPVDTLQDLVLDVPDVAAAADEVTETVRRKLREHQNDDDQPPVSKPVSIDADGIQRDAEREASEAQDAAAQVTSQVAKHS